MMMIIMPHQCGFVILPVSIVAEDEYFMEQICYTVHEFDHFIQTLRYRRGVCRLVMFLGKNKKAIPDDDDASDEYFLSLCITLMRMLMIMSLY